jgi:hypothetical protein
MMVWEATSHLIRGTHQIRIINNNNLNPSNSTMAIITIRSNNKYQINLTNKLLIRATLVDALIVLIDATSIVDTYLVVIIISHS